MFSKFSTLYTLFIHYLNSFKILLRLYSRLLNFCISIKNVLYCDLQTELAVGLPDRYSTSHQIYKVYNISGKCVSWCSIRLLEILAVLCRIPLLYRWFRALLGFWYRVGIGYHRASKGSIKKRNADANNTKANVGPRSTT